MKYEEIKISDEVLRIQNNFVYLYRLLTMKNIKSPIMYIADCYNRNEWVSLCM